MAPGIGLSGLAGRRHKPGGPSLSVRLGPDGPELAPVTALKGEHAVLVRTELAGVCRSDLKEAAGSRYGDSQFGHEVVGVVESSPLPELKPGQRVCLDPNVHVDRSTGFATEMWLAGPAELLAAALPKLPPWGDARRVIFTEPLACAEHCVRAVRRHLGAGLDGRRIGVLGAGTAGVLIAGLARSHGARVTLSNRSADRIEFLRACGVLDSPSSALGGDGGPPLAWAAGLRAGSADVAVVATSFVLPGVLAEALRAVRPGGLVVLFGGTAPGDALAGLDCDLDAVRRSEELILTSWSGKPVFVGGSYGTAAGDFRQAVEDLASEEPALPAERLITREITLPALPDVLREQLSARSLGKTIVWPSAG